MSSMKRASESISVVVPVYNSPDLDTLAARIGGALEDVEFEIIFVDDGSPDPSIWPALERLARENRHVRAFQLTRNFGQQAATLCGLRESRGDLVVTMDDDLQHDPDDIRALLAHSSHDVVIGQLGRREHSFSRRLASRAKGVVDSFLIGKPEGLRLSSFRLLRRSVVDAVVSLETTRPFLPALIFEVTRDAVGVPVRHLRRVVGRSGYTWRKLLRLSIDLLMSVTPVLMPVAAVAGLLVALSGALLAAFVIYTAASAGAIPDSLSLPAALLFVGGAILASVGCVGEYVRRVIEGREKRPAYFVRRGAVALSEAADRFDDARRFRVGERRE